MQWPKRLAYVHLIERRLHTALPWQPHDDVRAFFFPLALVQREREGDEHENSPSSSWTADFTTLSCSLLFSVSLFFMTHTLTSSLKHRSQHHSALTSLSRSLGVEPKPAAQNRICLRLCVTRPHIHAHTLTQSCKDSERAPKKRRGEP